LLKVPGFRLLRYGRNVVSRIHKSNKCTHTFAIPGGTQKQRPQTHVCNAHGSRSTEPGRGRSQGKQRSCSESTPRPRSGPPDLPSFSSRIRPRGVAPLPPRIAPCGGPSDFGPSSSVRLTSPAAIPPRRRRSDASEGCWRSSRPLGPDRGRDRHEEEGDQRLVSRDGGELPEKLVQGFPSLQITEEGLGGYPCPDEHRRSTRDFRVAVHDVCHRWHHRPPKEGSGLLTPRNTPRCPVESALQADRGENPSVEPCDR